MSSSWLVRLTLPSQPLGLRLLVLTLSAGWLGVSLGSVFFMVILCRLLDGPGPIAAWLTLASVGVLALAGHTALVHEKRWLGAFLLLGACGLGAALLNYTLYATAILGLIYGDEKSV